MSELVGMALLALPCALLGAIVALALCRWAPNLTVTARILLASTASICPVLGMVAIAAGGSPQVLLSMSADEFLIPFALQNTFITALAAPAAWLISRRRRKPRAPSDVFE